MLEFGDRVGVLTPPDRKEEIRRHFGDTVKATAEFSYVSLGIGMVMGVLLGLIPIPIPGVGTVTLGIGGGPLIVALILGKLRRTGPMLWTVAGKHRAPKFRPCDFSRYRRCQRRSTLRPYRRGIRVDDAVHRRRSSADDRVHRLDRRPLPAE